VTVWDRIAGQDHAKGVLAVAAPGGSYLFTGPKGVGKSEAARAFAASLLCPNSSEGAGACGVCSTCDRVLRELHPDVMVFKPEGFTYPVEAIREIVASAAMTPLEAARRVFIVEEADRIAERSQNALLKALEEPGPSVTWILVAAALAPFLPTILSRCRIVEFAPIAEENLRGLLRERLGLSAPAAAELVRMAGGEAGRAVLLATDEAYRNLRRFALETAARGAAGPAEALAAADRVFELGAEARDALAQKQSAEMEQLEATIATQRGSAPARKRLTDRHKRELRRAEVETYTEFLAWAGFAFRDLAHLSQGGDEVHLVNPDWAEELRRCSASAPASRWLALAQAALDGQQAIYENANPGMAIESFLLRLTAAPAPAL
jgi:DNA polymerase III subunit delta'